MNAPTVEWNRERVAEILGSSKKLCMDALLHLYAAQTPDERANHATHKTNGAGFSKFDAEILSSFAVQLKRRGYLSPKQMMVLRKRLPHYWRQLAPLMHSGDAVKAQEVSRTIEVQESVQAALGSW